MNIENLVAEVTRNTKARADNFNQLKSKYAQGNYVHKEGFELNDIAAVRHGNFDYYDIQIPEELVTEANRLSDVYSGLGYGRSPINLEDVKKRQSEFVKFFGDCETFELRLRDFIKDLGTKRE